MGKTVCVTLSTLESSGSEMEKLECCRCSKYRFIIYRDIQM